MPDPKPIEAANSILRDTRDQGIFAEAKLVARTLLALLPGEDVKAAIRTYSLDGYNCGQFELMKIADAYLSALSAIEGE